MSYPVYYVQSSDPFEQVKQWISTVTTTFQQAGQASSMFMTVGTVVAAVGVVIVANEYLKRQKK